MRLHIAHPMLLKLTVCKTFLVFQAPWLNNIILYQTERKSYWIVDSLLKETERKAELTFLVSSRGTEAVWILLIFHSLAFAKIVFKFTTFCSLWNKICLFHVSFFFQNRDSFSTSQAAQPCAGNQKSKQSNKLINNRLCRFMENDSKENVYAMRTWIKLGYICNFEIENHRSKPGKGISRCHA